MDILSFIFDPTPGVDFALQNHFIYLFLIAIVFSLVKRSHPLASITRTYSMLGLLFLGIRYENIPFFSMRAIFAALLIVGVAHVIVKSLHKKKNEHIQVLEPLRSDADDINIYAPKRKYKKNKKNKKKHSKQWKKSKKK
jgi:hypothetical protein